MTANLISQRILGDRVGRSAEWVKAVENGRLLPPRLSMLTQIATVLGVQDVAQLVEDTGGVPAEVFAGTRHAALSEVQAALTEGQEADDPYVAAGGAWAMVQALRDAGRCWRVAIERRRRARKHSLRSAVMGGLSE